MLPVPAMANRDDLAHWRKLWAEGAHGALLSEIGEVMKAGDLPPEGYGLGALACIALERFDEAVKAGQNGVALAPREPWLFGALAEAHRGLAKSTSRGPASAGLPARAAAAKGGAPAGDWTKASGATAGGSPAGDWAKAIAAADQAVRLAPAEPTWQALGARLRREAGFPAEALQAAERGLQRHPDSAHLLVERGLASWMLSLPQPPHSSGTDGSATTNGPGAAPADRLLAGALADLRQAQSLAPTDPWPFEAEGMLQTSAGNPSEAARAYRRALRLTPTRPAADEIEERLAATLAPRLAGPLRLLLLAARVTVIGWGVILFGYYIFFRLLQIGWKLAPAFKPFGQGLLLTTAVGGALLVVAGHLTRLLLRKP